MNERARPLEDFPFVAESDMSGQFRNALDTRRSSDVLLRVQRYFFSRMRGPSILFVPTEHEYKTTW